MHLPQAGAHLKGASVPLIFNRGFALEQIHTSESDFQISANLLDFRVSVSVSDFGFYLDRTMSYCNVWSLTIHVGKTVESLGEFN